jgi:uncharacterized protein YdhG (YjbR/CyaY superfamily)
MRTGQSQTPPSSIDEYIAAFPPEVQQKLEQIRSAIREAAPEAEETIKYRMPTYVLHGNLVHFAAFTKHVGFYPAPSGIATFKDELSRYKGAKGSVQFPIDEPIPVSLVKKIVRFRVEQSRPKSAAAKKKR